jgi:TRAP-type C4-dicarboxylate transport system permease small subunit
MLRTSLLLLLARAFSTLGGITLTALTLMTCYSVVGRNFFESALLGDFELTGIACGVAIACFMPLCQLKREHILVDFFTARCSAGVNAALDRVGAGVMAVIFALLAWRSALAAVSAHENMGASMLLGFPDWILLAAMAVPFALSALIALVQAVALQAVEGGAA